ncbi:LPXTG cell wall anchor domain-containing protein [Streptococcus pluranimalium]|uniref:Gram-positive cocci surface proteins LPxTG domain-containing protein n=1 Tax=Streptococcus pluranimalium TaxID=82348 RepID=A0A345VMZ5_9STRE|nr:LPXTG cell wall anchor domain-containing protein [Streptococcus pluranimalium]AXJ14097.1 hypothetical protein Sp14A_22150 [Streptococcus pluranimalium]
MTRETKQIFSIRKFKTGTHSALLGKASLALATTAVLMGAGGAVSAEETTAPATQPATEQVAPTESSTAEATTPAETPAVTSDIPTSVPETTTQDQAVTAVDDAQATLKDNVATAKDTGVVVKEGETEEVVINDSNASEKTSEVLTDLNKQDQAVKEATAKQAENQKAYEETKTARDVAVSEGQASLSKSTKAVDDQIAIAEKNDLKVTTKTTDKTPEYKDTKGLTGDALREAMAENIKLYNEAVKSATTTMDASTAKMKKEIDAYILALSNYKKGIATNTGLKWQSGVTLTAGAGAQKMSGAENVVSFADGTLKSAAMYATQSNALNQNTDADFNNIFKINGKGTIYVKNTTNGDVTLTFSEINSPGNTGTYVAVWGDNNGGIAWSVFALYNGAATGGAGEAATGGTGVGGRILNYVYSYKVKAVTSNAVSVVTFNDIDNKQTITVSGLDGASITKGKNVTGSGNTYGAGTGDKSQGSSGKLDSNGVGWTFEEAKVQDFTVVHSVDGKNTSIVGGIFGAASEVPKEPKKPTLTAEKVTVEAPDAPEAPKPIEVKVHYYKMMKTPTPDKPTPSTPQNPTPETPVQGASVATLPQTGESDHVSTLATALGLMTIGFVGFGLKKKKEEN